MGLKILGKHKKLTSNLNCLHGKINFSKKIDFGDLQWQKFHGNSLQYSQDLAQCATVLPGRRVRYCPLSGTPAACTQRNHGPQLCPPPTNVQKIILIDF